MILSVVIVSYNVKYFLEQCLSSLKKSIGGISISGDLTEVFIIDNASSDGSPDFLETLYPDFHFIRNKENNGFAKANNLVLPMCRGEFVLFLNPDTILAEDSLQICISFFREQGDAGAVGVRMIDGAGRFLRESKRGFPYPAASFFKMSGLVHLFPRSKIFSSYYMGHLNNDHTHAVDVLSGAFMMVKKTVLDKTGGFDEQFFMYAEDIDLSFRISQAGFKNYYLPATTILHFKGESTKKDIRYVKMFYSAMRLFVKKHFENKGSPPRLYLLNLGLGLRQSLSFFRLPFKNSVPGIKGDIPFFIKGIVGKDDEVAMQKMKDDQIRFSDTEKEAGAIVFFEGPTLSWKKIISDIRARPGQHVYLFHGAGTHAIISSVSVRKPGQIIELLS